MNQLNNDDLDASFDAEHCPRAEQQNSLELEPDLVTNLLTINTDCKLEILKNLPCLDLGSVADLPLLKESAGMVFVSKWKRHVTLYHEYRDRAHDFLHNFGPEIKGIRLLSLEKRKFDHVRDRRIMRSMSQYCYDTLESLEIHWLELKNRNFALAEDENRSLFSGLQILILKDCLISINLLTMCNVLTELSLIRIEEIDDDAQRPRLNLNKLKTLKVEMHPKIRCRHRHCNMNATHLDSLGYEMHRKMRLPYLQSIEFINEAENLEYVEIDTLSEDLFSPMTKSISKFENIRTLKIYCEYVENHRSSLENIAKLEHLNVLVWGYPKKFNARNLHYVIKTARNLQLFIVSFSRRLPICERALRPMSAESYEKILETVSSRSNGKPLDVIVVGHRYETQLKQFEVAAPMHAKLKFTCLSSKIIGPILNIDITSPNARIKMTDEQIEVLRDRGMIP